MIEGLSQEITIQWQVLSRDELVKLKLLDIALLSALLSLGTNNIVIKTTELLLLAPYYKHLTGLLHRLQALSMLEFISCYKRNNKLNIILHPKTYELFKTKEVKNETV